MLPLFADRHVGPGGEEVQQMLGFLGFSSLEDLVRAVIPGNLLAQDPLAWAPALSETACLSELDRLGSQNQVGRSFLSLGYQAAAIPGMLLNLAGLLAIHGRSERWPVAGRPLMLLCTR